MRRLNNSLRYCLSPAPRTSAQTRKIYGSDTLHFREISICALAGLLARADLHNTNVSVPLGLRFLVVFFQGSRKVSIRASLVRPFLRGKRADFPGFDVYGRKRRCAICEYILIYSGLGHHMRMNTRRRGLSRLDGNECLSLGDELVVGLEAAQIKDI